MARVDKVADERPLPNGWRWVRFGDVVRNINRSERDPQAAGLERYVGLDHLDPESFRITRWGSIQEGTTFTRRFDKGQVLFAKRRAYQRKAAIADFEGVCSGDLLVFETKGELLAELLPFVVTTDGFFNHALGTSAGSLSPRTKWSELAKYEFPLPPESEQQLVARLLHGADETAELLADSANRINVVRVAYFEEALRNLAASEVPLGSLLTVCQYGLSKRASSEGSVAILGMANISGGLIDESSMGFVDITPAELKAYRLQPGDILFNRTNSFDLVGKTGIYDLVGEHVFASYLIRLRVDEDRVLPEYINAYLGSVQGQNRLRTYVTRGVSQSNINASSLKSIPVPLPRRVDQEAIVTMMNELIEGSQSLKDHSRLVNHLKEQILSRLFEAPVRDQGV